jgi:acyl carrier protein
MADRVSRVISELFDVPVEDVRDQDGPETIEGWDSLKHIHLVLALEAEFDLLLSPDDAAEMLSIGAIRELLGRKGVGSVAVTEPR